MAESKNLKQTTNLQRFVFEKKNQYSKTERIGNSVINKKEFYA